MLSLSIHNSKSLMPAKISTPDLGRALWRFGALALWLFGTFVLPGSIRASIDIDGSNGNSTAPCFRKDIASIVGRFEHRYP
jgi:hypothetical protein